LIEPNLKKQTQFVGGLIVHKCLFGRVLCGFYMI
jgi:hypothetical protein